ncbi:bifunctional 4-hydroxy-2-oxoglutarate aldolase/2-dehydro-3-deoxy-phosphogluconate aldolase [Aeromonas encheleia]|jgi:2-dehydro-3-deoxyphosphogluconate aldolase/(4S)-4-hydroxy-2-oxoglutarate aldolase|uniref:bifunctional 4-hydroxy-2-oxoglutarate aldolase/2-dehydro-3-deoxy-phosphogluconate aldolase n=1 Tax=Aeromonas encheleia TaxID=73010 RepID=UPI001F58D742|nr:bifunctional 4-hydroxy-2-oxoglutarate aldolase/2-dehydro-3-deoxy-phosphogluconate aldolase [Aeromonas encheleia]UNP88399.1 bifunctional 4-hydroxy-2-oxoglutarate aldolase/2-dehydro-3-deoxy-phosphogluconate aldolase [Aeromonas encheleia]
MQNWKVTPAEVFAASPLVPVMVINDLDQALPMAQALLAGGISVFEITLRTPVALDAIALIAKAMPEAMVGAGTVLNCAQFDAAVAAGARFVISPGMTPALLAHAAKSTAPLIPGVATASEVMQALEAGYSHLKFFPAEANGGTKALAAIAAPLPQVRFCPTGGIGPHNVADYLALKCVATVGGSWMLPADAVKNGNWEEVTRLSREAVALVQR